MKTPSLLAHYLGGFNRRRTGPSRLTAALEIMALAFLGVVFAAALFLTILGTMAIGSLLTEDRETSHQSPVTSHDQP